MIREALPNRRLQRVVFRCLTVVDVVTARCAQRWIRPGACLAIDRQTEEALLDELSAVDADVANFRHQCPSQPTLEVDHRLHRVRILQVWIEQGEEEGMSAGRSPSSADRMAPRG